MTSSFAFSASRPFDSNAISSTGLSQEQAKQLLILVLLPEKYRLSNPDRYINGDLQGADGQPDHPGYVYFSVFYENPQAAATAYLGYYSVNIKTGDVWEVESCVRYHFPKLIQLQHDITQHTGASLADEKIARDEVGYPGEGVNLSS